METVSESVVERARLYAIEMHDHVRASYGGGSYAIHLTIVDSIGKMFLDEVHEEHRKIIQCAIWCHDLAEDARQNYNDIRSHIGDRAARVVMNVTNEVGDDRLERSLKTYPKIMRDPLAIFVKCCDRYANTQFSKDSGSKMYEKYKKEYVMFRYVLKKDGMYPKLWEALDKLNDYKEI